MVLHPRSRVLGSLLVAAAWLAPGSLLLVLRDGTPRALAAGPQDDGAGARAAPRTQPNAKAQPAPRTSRRSAAKDAGAEKPKTAEQPASAAPPPLAGDVSFKQDVAPILVANCVGCHSSGRPGLTRGKLDLTTFEKLMAGTPKEKIIEAGKPDDSHLVLRVRGEEQPRMPMGGNNNGLSDETIARFERWISAGARLDAGLDPRATLQSYAATPEQVRRNLLARLGAKEREQLVEKAGRDRWKKADPKLTPEIQHSEHFVLFSNLPKDRAANVLKLMEAQHATLRRILGAAATSWPEKVSVYVFNSRKEFVELVRSLQNRELDPDVASIGDLNVPQPFLAVADPQGGRKDEPAGVARRKARGKQGERETDGTARTLPGLLSQGLGEAVVAAYGKSPHWLAYGIGEYLGALAEPRGVHARNLRRLAHQKYDQGWITRATDVLGESDQVGVREMRGISLALIEALLDPEVRGAFPQFAQGMSQKGKEKLDDVLKDVYGMSREDFLNSTGDWIAGHYGSAE